MSRLFSCVFLDCIIQSSLSDRQYLVLYLKSVCHRLLQNLRSSPKLDDTLLCYLPYLHHIKPSEIWRRQLVLFTVYIFLVYGTFSYNHSPKDHTKSNLGLKHLVVLCAVKWIQEEWFSDPNLPPGSLQTLIFLFPSKIQMKTILCLNSKCSSPSENYKDWKHFSTFFSFLFFFFKEMFRCIALLNNANRYWKEQEMLRSLCSGMLWNPSCNMHVQMLAVIY